MNDEDKNELVLFMIHVFYWSCLFFSFFSVCDYFY